MSLRSYPFDGLIAGLRGRPGETMDWMQIIALANHTLLTPSLYSALVQSQQIEKLPEDARGYLQFVAQSNQERNLRLRAQLYEAVAAFNEAGITPLLLKGAVPLFLASDDTMPDRMTSDLDVAVENSEMPVALACLEALGYAPVSDFRGMARPQDVGLFELRPKEEGIIGASSEKVERAGSTAVIPFPNSRAVHWLLHDLIKEGDFMRGRIDLRHLHDLAKLSTDVALDWKGIRAAMPDRTSCTALDVQIYALRDLFGVDVTDDGSKARSIRFHHWRRTFPARHPVAGAPLRVLGNLVWGFRRASQMDVLSQNGLGDTVRRIFRVVFKQRPRGKL